MYQSSQHCSTKKSSFLKVFVLTLFLFTATTAATAQNSLPNEVPSQDPSKAKISPELQSKFETKPNTFSTQSTEKIQVMVSLGNYKGNPSISEMKKQSIKSQQGLQKLAEKSPKIEIKNRFWITNAILLEADPNFPIQNIAGVKNVRQLNTNAKVSLLQSPSDMSKSSEISSKSSLTTYGLNQINTTEVWSKYGTKGGGVKVAVLDTGVDPDHPDISIKNPNWRDFVYNDSTIQDYRTHGTHVSGTVVGGNSSGISIGVAPESTLLAGAVFDENGDASGILEGMQWAVDENSEVLSMSLGTLCSTYPPYIDAVRNAKANDVLVVAASGNSREGCSGSPANVYESLSVGASAENGSIAGFSSGELIDKSADWSSPPHSWPDNYVVPDVAGPGVDVISAYPGETYDYAYSSGTSMATPHVSGAAALMESATSVDLTPDQMKEAFEETAWKPGDGTSAAYSIGDQDSRYGHGIIDAYAATEYAVTNFDQPGILKISDKTVEAGTVNKIQITVQTSMGNTIEDDRFTINTVNEDGLNLSNSATTNSSGIATFSFNETMAGSYTPEFKLSSNSSVSKSVEIVVEPSNPYSLSASNISARAGSKNSIAIALEDLYGNNISDGTINLRNQDGLNISSINETTNSSGQTSFSFNETNAAAYKPVFQAASNANVSATSSVTVSPIEPENIVFTKNNSKVTAGNKSKFIIEIRDIYGNPTSNHTGFDDIITVESGTLEPETVNISGDLSEKSFNWSYTKKGWYNISTNTTLKDSNHVIRVDPGEINTSQTNITANKDNITADGTSTTQVTVIARDQYGNSLESGGENISLNTTAGTLLDAVIDQDNGNYTQTLQSSTNLEKAQINASIDNHEITDYATVDFVAGSPASINVSKNGDATADNKDNIQVTVRINDSNFNPVKDVEINISTSSELNTSQSNTTDQNGEAFFNFTTTKAESHEVEFTADNLSQKIDLVFNPGRPQEISFNTVGNQTIGEPFNITLSAVDKYNNIATNYTNKTNLSSQVDITPSQTGNFTKGQLKNQTITVDYNKTLQNIKINASDNITGQSNSFNLTKPKPPKINVFDVNASLLLQNETVGIKINDTTYTYNNDIERSLNISEQKLTLENAQEYDFKANYTSDKIKDYTLNLTVTDVFNQTASRTKNVSFRDPSQFSANITGSKPNWSFKDPEGNTRHQNSTSEINSTLPSDDNWTLTMESDNQSIDFKSVNVTKDVNESFELQTGLTPEIENVENTKTLALNTSLNFSTAKVSTVSTADTVQKCSDWDFTNQDCNGEWENVTSQASFSNNQASITVSSFSAYAFGESIEEDEDKGSNDEQDSSSGGGGGGGYSLPPSDNTTENQTNTTTENQTMENSFNQTENQTGTEYAVNTQNTRCEQFNSTQVPRNWTIIENCNDWEKNKAEQIIDNLTNVEDSITVENREILQRIRQEYEKGNYTGVIQLNNSYGLQKSVKQEKLLSSKHLLFLLVSMVLTGLTGFYLLYRFESRRNLVSQVESLKEKVKKGDVSIDSDKLLEANKAIENKDYTKAKKKIREIQARLGSKE